MTKINNFRAIALIAAAALATSLLMMTNLLGDPARASTLEATLVGAGDIASCSHHRDRATANVVGNVQGTVFRFRGRTTMGVVFFGSPAVVTPQRPQVQERQSGHV
jgi:hypothetical protein